MNKLNKQSKRKERFDLVKPHYHRIHEIVKFYSKCSEEELNALKYYKGIGVKFMTPYLLESKIPDRLNIIPFRKFDYEYVHQCLGIKTPNNTDIPLSKVKDYIENYINLQVDQINIMDNMFARKDITRLDDQIMLYRGMECEGKDKMKVGDNFTFKNFISTSLDRTVSERYLSDYLTFYGKHKCLFVLKNLKDIPYLYLQPFSGVYHTKSHDMLNTIGPEHDLFEYVLPRGIRVQIKDVKEEYATDNLFSWMLSYSQLDKVFKKDYDPNTQPSLFVKFTVYYCDITGIEDPTPVKQYSVEKQNNFNLNV